MKIETPRNILLFLLLFLGIGAITGGGSLIISPSGKLLRIPLSMLEKSPFMLITLSILIIFIMVLIIGEINLSLRFDKEVKELFSQSKSISNETFSYKQLSNLPEPVQRYFRHVLKEGQLYINYARLTHDGLFKTGLDKKWLSIKGEQYFTTENPGFIWKGKTTMFTARDMYIAGKGRLVVSLFSLFNIVNGQGEKFNQGELLRWLAESVWFPTNLLPSQKLQWTTIDNHTAKLTFKYNGLSIFYITTFNDTGEIIEIETKRFMGNGNMETWIGKLTNYKDLNGIKVPTIIEALWKLEEGDFSYARFNLKMIEYNKPEKF
ncbi:hypothetical protein SAMN05518672_111170 [Chitinophaga sp. CF118]|uniref:DUF6544 family protein n=1 Tax=Chitinophaga sp. CF118 TaxID=1884367 RepID=UPI0008F2A8BF|nr:DUF6544 family protein [Chitinophaga sp. CF118]SFE88687.1 hypothetical protein SAMN05518672_111170 [Chitinophaga sp. CF118]